MINCTRCLAVQSTFIVSDTLDESMDYDPQCLECKNHRQVSSVFLYLFSICLSQLFIQFYMIIEYIIIC